MRSQSSFRPQQGLLIMKAQKRSARKYQKNSFRPQQGLLIMNGIDLVMVGADYTSSFRPQQGLLIMKFVYGVSEKYNYEFPSPTGVTNYENYV